MPRSTFGVASSSRVWAISSAVICRCISAVDMGLLLELIYVAPGWRVAPDPEPRDSGFSLRERRNDLRSFHRLNPLPVRFAVAEGLERDVLQHGVAELVL